MIIRPLTEMAEFQRCVELQRETWGSADIDIMPARYFVTTSHTGGLVLGAFDGENVVATVTLLLGLPPNQPHRAEIAKMMTKVSHRHRGIATALMRAAEKLAIERGRTLLVLDTAVDDGASSLYEGLGFNLTGIIPDYALKPHGGLTGTMIYWKRL